MDLFQLAQLLDDHRRANRLYHEFLRIPTLSMGLYVLPAGAEDPQRPHREDEVYYVVRGRGQIQVDGEDRAIEEGSLILVKANAVHRFHTITEDLTLLVFFAPAEGTPTRSGI